MTIELIIEFAIGLVLLIFIHEFGHFIACRLLGIEVEEFGFGFPPRALTLFEAGGTKFTLNWLPLGGFVRPKGETDPDIKGGMAAASPLKRIAMFIAGPIMNLMLAVFLFFMLYAILGSLPDRSRVQLSEIVPGSPAAIAGLQPGDVLVSVGGEVIHSLDSARTQIYANLGKPLPFVYLRNGVSHGVSITPLTNPGSSGAVGVQMTYPMKAFTVLDAIPESFTSLYEYGKELYALVGQIVQGQSNPSQGRLTGIVGMFSLYRSVRETPSTPGVPNIVNILLFFASISISLGIMNLLPIPPLDGGKIVFALPELIIHRRIPVKYELWVSSIAFLLLIILMIYINAQDVIHPIITITPTP
jgi:regulator of sigma E protease